MFAEVTSSISFPKFGALGNISMIPPKVHDFSVRLDSYSSGSGEQLSPIRFIQAFYKGHKLAELNTKLIA
uniref:Uncharacterized protein n=1 Tax=Steinernema glaseri TaxID=37863 RepID=A0A1I8A934_9BILA